MHFCDLVDLCISFNITQHTKFFGNGDKDLPRQVVVARHRSATIGGGGPPISKIHSSFDVQPARGPSVQEQGRMRRIFRWYTPVGVSRSPSYNSCIRWTPLTPWQSVLQGSLVQQCSIPVPNLVAFQDVLDVHVGHADLEAPIAHEKWYFHDMIPHQQERLGRARRTDFVPHKDAARE